MSKKKFSYKDIEKVNGAIISCFIANFYLNECDSLKIFRHTSKKNVSKTKEDLEVIEKKFFDKIDEVDENNNSDKIVSNHIEFLEWLLNKYSYHDFTKLQEICVAFSLDKTRLTGISDKILIENGAKK